MIMSGAPVAPTPTPLRPVTFEDIRYLTLAGLPAHRLTCRPSRTAAPSVNTPA